MESDDDLKMETQQVKYWDECLSSLAKQYEILLNSLNLNKNIQLKRDSFIDQIKLNYKNKSKQFKQEPSHLYALSEMFFDFYSCLRDSVNIKNKSVVPQIMKNIQEIIANINKTKNEACKSSFRIIKKCKDLIINIKKQENEYQKAKTSLDDAQIYQKKIKNVDKYTYNVAKKEKADLQLSEKIKEMEKIKKPLENDKKKLLEYRNKLKVSLKDNFELIVTVSFKQLANYYQCLFLLLNEKIDILKNIKEKIDDILIQLSNLILDLNAYSEKKYGEKYLGLKSENVANYLSDELLNKSSIKQLIEISTNVINYVKIFLICLRYRKKIMKIFLETITEINKYEIDINKELETNQKVLINELDSLKNINYYNQKNWRNALAREKISKITTDIKTIIPIINSYIEFARNEQNIISNNWKNFEEKISQRQNLSIDFLKELDEAKKNNQITNQKEYKERYDKKKRKLKEAVKSGVDFIQKTVPTTREKDKNEMLKLESAFEILFNNCQNSNNEILSSTEDDLNTTVVTDIFEECKFMIIKYFNRFKIQNYENFLETMKIKLLVNTNLNEEQLGKGVYRRLSLAIDDDDEEVKLYETNDNIIFDDSQSKIPFDIDNNIRKSKAQSIYSKNINNENPFDKINNINDNIEESNLNNNVNTNIQNVNNEIINNSTIIYNNKSNLSKILNPQISNSVRKSNIKNIINKKSILSKSININDNNIKSSIKSNLSKNINFNNDNKNIANEIKSNLNKSINANMANNLNRSINANVDNNLNKNIDIKDNNLNNYRRRSIIVNNAKTNFNKILNNNNNNINKRKSIFNKNNIVKSVNIIGHNDINQNLNNNENNNLNKSLLTKNKNNLSKSVNINIKESLNSNINNEEGENEFINSIDEVESECNISSYQILNELEKEDNLELIDDNKITRYTEMKDPYSNIKEDELNRLLNIKGEETKKRELGEGENKIKSFSCSLSGRIISRGTLMITNKKIEFYSSIFKKIQIIIPLIDIISVRKKSDNSIQIKTEKITYLFTSFTEQDFCYSLLDKEIKRVKKEVKEQQKNNNEEEKVDENSPEQKYLGKKRFKAKQISKMLEEIDFYKKLEEITKERMELFTKEYTDEKKGFFVSQKSLKRKYAEEIFKDCPLYVIFTTLIKMTTQLEEYKKNKGFFESLFLQRNDTEVEFKENPDFLKIPNYFDNGDYVMNLFSQFNKEDFETFLNDIQNWPHKYEYSCHAVHKVKQVPFGPSQVVMRDKFIAYFISPTLLIFDDMAYATEFTFSENFIPLFRYTFDCNIKFNDKKGKFEFDTKMTITYVTIFLVNFMLKSTVESKSNSDTEELVKGEILDKLKESVNIYRDRFKDIFERVTDETFQRKIDLKQNMITGEFEEDVIEGVVEEENPEEEEDKNKVQNEEKENIENNKNEKGGIHQKINEFIDKNKTYIFIGIISLIIIGIILSIFGSNKGKGSIAFDTIFNLVILGAIFYLFKFK